MSALSLLCGTSSLSVGGAYDAAMPAKWKNLLLLSLAELLAMSLWFSASAVVPQLTAEWSLTGGQQAWLSMSVQLGFVVGALGSALLNIADRVAAQRLFVLAALAGAGFNAAIAQLGANPDFTAVLLLRTLTGASLAGVYPPAMKLMVSWFRRRRGFAIGVVVGAVTVGSALPHLFNALPIFPGPTGLPAWPAVLLVASAAALAAALIVGLFVSSGPHLPAAAPFNPRQTARAFVDPALRLVNLGYLGHMWELYAMWTWVPLFLLETYRAAGHSDESARLAGFAVVAIGGLGSVFAGAVADRLGRTRVTIWSLAVSGGCALTMALFGLAVPFGGAESTAGQAAASAASMSSLQIGLVTALCLLWGIAVVADSAQFSTAVSELCDPEYVGTALTMQTTLGFLLTLITIRMVPPLVAVGGWSLAFGALAAGPVIGIRSMRSLRGRPEAVLMSSRNR